MSGDRVAGLLLAAGGGRRLGGPKALLTDETGQLFVVRALATLTDGGCAPVYAVVGAGADDVRAKIPAAVEVVVAEGWARGMGVSLRAGLDALSGMRRRADVEGEVEAALVMLVDTPSVTADVVRRLITRATAVTATGEPADVRRALSRATYAGEPGHPVVIGREHWAGVRASAQGDRGARDYLQTHVVDLVECADIGGGDDVDTADALAAWRETQLPER